jgi:hypothetical protein
MCADLVCPMLGHFAPRWSFSFRLYPAAPQARGTMSHRASNEVSLLDSFPMLSKIWIAGFERLVRI